MMNRKTRAQRAIAIIMALIVVLPVTPLAWQTVPGPGAQATPPSTTPTARSPNAQGGTGPSATAADAPPIDGDVPHDRQEPGQHRAAPRVVASGITPGAHERLLRDVLRRPGVPDDRAG